MSFRHIPTQMRVEIPLTDPRMHELVKRYGQHNVEEAYLLSSRMIEPTYNHFMAVGLEPDQVRNILEAVFDEL